MNIDINFENVYPLNAVSTDSNKSYFFTELVNGERLKIIVEIEQVKNPFVNDFLSLAFGPAGTDGEINDFAAVKHLDYSKAFSTVIFYALTFMKNNPGIYLGIDGSDFRRAYLYYRILQRNYDYLNDYFRIYGIKYYVRLLRGKDKNDSLNIDEQEVKSIPTSITKTPLTKHKSLFNCFLFSLSL
ncbi:hypothetical protein SAMN05518672_103806 [Chitinophaga sp. CF118]|uniref:DUF6934 family protein n=1 Tax=Chitinophaga sp. CF118 TaxID=1884367 RepID=UPI0008E2370A|nr:hypothetical protein [Chitinophaga sp. CF118]SFD90940.1 hypothetical protein SAMN05518672_103806 [Chitinophaga sp. CF118]